MLRSLMVVFAVVVFCYGLPVQAQYLPLHLDQSITLPATNGLWDVMPHPDGYYMWVQATEPDTEQTRIYWGRTDLGNIDFVDLDVGSPQSITCFWRENHEPYVVLASRYLFPLVDIQGDSTYFRAYSLQDGRPDSAFWLWPASVFYPGPGLNSIGHDLDFRVSTVALYPAPPQTSTQVLVSVSHSENYSFTHIASIFFGFSSPLRVINMLRNSANQSGDLTDFGSFATWCACDDTPAFVYSGTSTNGGSSSAGSWVQTIRSIQAVRSIGDSLSVADSLWHCSIESFEGCSADIVAATYNSQSRVINCFTHLTDHYGMLSSPSGSIWSVPGPYNYWLAAECISGNPTEEFLAYDTTRRVFDVFNAVDGHYFGITDTLTFATNEVKTIGRYDSTSRRLATRSGNHLNLYTFGQYLGADDPKVNLHPSAFSLFAFPNPFNPNSTISFTLPRVGEVKLLVYDIAGRELKSLTEGVLSAGEHHITFDGSALPSGIYFARLNFAGMVKTQKLLLLK